jgi:hypothetical protein
MKVVGSKTPIHVQLLALEVKEKAETAETK